MKEEVLSPKSEVPSPESQITSPESQVGTADPGPRTSDSLADMIASADAEMLNQAGNAFSDRGMWKEALACYERSLELRQAAGDRRGQGIVLNNLGAIYYGLGDWKQAQQYYEESLAIAQAVGDQSEQLFVLMNLGFLSYALGQPAEELLARAQTLAEALGREQELMRLAWMRGDLALQRALAGDDSAYAPAFAAYAAASGHAAHLGQEHLQQTMSFIDEHLARLAEANQRLAALAFCDYLLAYGQDNTLGPEFAAHYAKKREELLYPPLLGA
jgi:tetratricopeptide (TPR) repeat protein